jgi:predicted dinucleotide-binding enzyme
MPREINSVGVVGGGLMGAGIAEVSAVAGMPVVVRDLPQFLDAARERVEKSLAGAVKRGKIDQAKRDEVLTRITFTPDLKDVASADIVIEAIPEILDLKVSLIKELDELVSPGNVIAEHLVHPDRRAGRQSAASGTGRRSPFLLAGSGDEAGRNRGRAGHRPGDGRHRVGVRQQAG